MPNVPDLVKRVINLAKENKVITAAGLVGLAAGVAVAYMKTPIDIHQCQQYGQLTLEIFKTPEMLQQASAARQAIDSGAAPAAGANALCYADTAVRDLTWVTFFPTIAMSPFLLYKAFSSIRQTHETQKQS